jgi:hypothetical protein
VSPRSRAAGLVAAAALCVLGSGLAAVTAHASEQPGSDFLGYTLTAQAAGLQVVEDEPSATTHPEAESEVPQSQVSLVSGPVGYALSSVAWPGALAANAGSLLLLAGAPVPPDVAGNLNDPVRAETRTGGPASVENTDVPGAVMRADVVPGKVSATTVLDGGTAGQTAGFGATTTSSTAALATAKATTTADSTTRDVSLAGGALTLGSLVSHATASTDGRTATGSGSTLVGDLRIAGVPVTVDQHGVTVASNTTPADASAVQGALTQLGMTVLLSKPSVSRSGGAISYDAGSLIVDWFPPGWGGRITVLLGGARVSASANPADAPPVPPSGTTVPPVAGPGGTGSVPGVPGGDVTPTTLPPAQDTGSPAVPRPVTEAALLQGHRAPASSYALAVVAALLLLGALLRFPPLVLVPPATAVCDTRNPLRRTS